MIYKALTLFMLFSCSLSAEPFISHQSVAAVQLQTLSAKEMDANWNVDQFFGSVFVINLPQSTERLKRVTEALYQIGVRDFEVSLPWMAAKMSRKSFGKKWIAIGPTLIFRLWKAAKNSILRGKLKQVIYLSHLDPKNPKNAL